jgi:hypothetical protein
MYTVRLVKYLSQRKIFHDEFVEKIKNVLFISSSILPVCLAVFKIIKDTGCKNPTMFCCPHCFNHFNWTREHCTYLIIPGIHCWKAKQAVYYYLIMIITSPHMQIIAYFLMVYLTTLWIIHSLHEMTGWLVNILWRTWKEVVVA